MMNWAMGGDLALKCEACVDGVIDWGIKADDAPVGEDLAATCDRCGFVATVERLNWVVFQDKFRFPKDESGYRPPAERAKPKPKPQGSVYLIRDVSTGHTKIGFSQSPLKRLASLQTAVAGTLQLVGMKPGTIDDERALHAMFKQRHVRGEWFALTDSDISLIIPGGAPT